MRRAAVAYIVLLAALVGCRDARRDAPVQASYDNIGKLRLLTYDSDGNAKPDTWAYMDGTRILRVEIDKNEDGVIERREYYDARKALEKVEISTTSDGKITRTEFYDAGALARAEEDTNADGNVDRWETYANGLVQSVAFDIDGTGHPTRRLVYAGDGRLLQIETGGDLASHVLKR